MDGKKYWRKYKEPGDILMSGWLQVDLQELYLGILACVGDEKTASREFLKVLQGGLAETPIAFYCCSKNAPVEVDHG